MRTHAVLLFMIGLAPAAAAQQPRTQATDREQAYGRRLAEVLRSPDGAQVRPVRVRVDPRSRPLDHFGVAPESQPPEPEGSGIEVDLGALKVQRLRFGSPREAQQHLALIARQPGPPSHGELRGDQVLTVTGRPILEDQLLVQLLQGSLWEGLPAPNQALDASFTRLGNGNLVASTTMQSGPVRDLIDYPRHAALASTKAYNYAPVKIDTREERRVEVTRIAFPSGYRARVRTCDFGSSVVVARRAEDLELVDYHLYLIGGHPNPLPRSPSDPPPPLPPSSPEAHGMAGGLNRARGK